MALIEQFLSGFFASSGVPITALPISLTQSEVGSPESILLMPVTDWSYTAARHRHPTLSSSAWPQELLSDCGLAPQLMGMAWVGEAAPGPQRQDCLSSLGRKEALLLLWQPDAVYTAFST